jgi:pimeloyl-ACP methyl ester carboxylesterase
VTTPVSVFVTLCACRCPARLQTCALPPPAPPAPRYVAAHSPLPGGNAGFSKAQLSRLTAPTLVIAAEKDVFWPGKAVAAAAEASLPACKTMVIPGRHLPSRAKLAECMEEVLSFWAVSKLI